MREVLPNWSVIVRYCPLSTVWFALIKPTILARDSSRKVLYSAICGGIGMCSISAARFWD